MKRLHSSPTVALIIMGVVAIASIGVMLLVELPTLKDSREKLDQARTQTLVLEYQQTNLELVRRQLEDVQKYQTELGSYVWKFETEESFFQAWENLGSSPSIQVSELSLADAVPSGELLVRSGSVKIEGSPNQVLTGLSEVQQIKPVIGITAITVSSLEAKTVQAQVDFSTIWQ